MDAANLDTIAAIATPPGHGGVAVIRISGSSARSALKAIFKASAKGFSDFAPRKLHHGLLISGSGEVIDEALVVFMPGPNSFTGEDVAEIHCHGGLIITRMIMERIFELGARQAERGEFTRRALLNGRIDLTQAEAVAELIAAPTEEARKYSLKRLSGALGLQAGNLKEKLDQCCTLATAVLDFSEEELAEDLMAQFDDLLAQTIDGLNLLLAGAKRAQVFSDKPLVVLAGMPNAGKSSIFNSLVGIDRALVTPIPGTTRDFLESVINLDGLAIRLIDTAGLSEGSVDDPIEALGREKTESLIKDADLVLLVLDGAYVNNHPELLDKPDYVSNKILTLAGKTPVLALWNKRDVAKPPAAKSAWGAPLYELSAKTGLNMEELSQKIRSCLLTETSEPVDGIAPNGRQERALQNALQSLLDLKNEIETDTPMDCAFTHLETARQYLDELIGVATSEEILDRIFSQFCIGK